MAIAPRRAPQEGERRRQEACCYKGARRFEQERRKARWARGSRSGSLDGRSLLR